MFIDLILVLVDETYSYLERCGIGSIALLALLNGVLLLILAELEAYELEGQVSSEVLDR